MKAARARQFRNRCEVRVAVDETGQDGEVREIDRLRSAGKLLADVRRFSSGLNFAALNPDELIGGVISGADIEYFSCVDGDVEGRRRF